MGRATHVFVNWDLAIGRRLCCQLDGPMRPRLCLATTTARAASLQTTRNAVNHQKGDSETMIQAVYNGDSGPNISWKGEKQPRRRQGTSEDYLGGESGPT